MTTHKLPGKESTAHEMCAQIFLKMQNRCHPQVFGQGTGEGNSPGRKEEKKVVYYEFMRKLLTTQPTLTSPQRFLHIENVLSDLSRAALQILTRTAGPEN